MGTRNPKPETQLFDSSPPSTKPSYRRRERRIRKDPSGLAVEPLCSLRLLRLNRFTYTFNYNSSPTTTTYLANSAIIQSNCHSF